MGIRRVLLVEDDRAIRETIAELLEAEGYGVRCAGNGAEALALLASEAPPQVIVLDLMMPVMDGWEFREALKRDPHLARIPVIVLSASNRLEQRIDALGAAAFLPKPFEVGRLLAAVERCC
jgi:CheY-like chemotaxis protein